MSLEPIFPEVLIHRIGWWLIHFTWQASLIALITGSILFALNKASANLRYILCCCAFVFMIVLPVGTVMIATNTPNHLLITVSTKQLSPVVAKDIYWDKVKIGTQYRSQAASTPTLNVVAKYLETNLPMIILGWMSGVFLLSAYRLMGFINLYLKIRSIRSPRESQWEIRIQKLIRRLQIKQKIQILISTIVGVPAVIGWVKPVLLIPVSFFSGMNPQYFESIIIHELAHIRRYDYLVNMIQMVVEALGFFHPAVWWLSHRIRQEREHCCDDWAVHVLGDKLIYVKSLVHLEEKRHLNSPVLAANGSSLFHRITRILNHPVRRSSSASMVTFIFSLGILCLFLFFGFTGFSRTGDDIWNSDQDVSKHLVAYYPFNGNARDESGFQQHGVVHNNATLTEDRFGRKERAFDFNGKDGHIVAKAMEDTSQSVTVSCWIYPRRRSKYVSWVGKMKAKESWTSQWRVGFGEDKNNEWGFTECQWDKARNFWMDYWAMQSEIPLERWTHVTAVADNEKHMVSLYVNGRRIVQMENLGPFEKTSTYYLIGYQNDDKVFFDGKIDDIRIYNLALNEKEVLAVYQMK
jgi:beta-lactamase regulating signal transducer with metallopeptidase domain